MQVRHGWKIATLLMQLRVLRFGFLQDGNIRISIFPKRKGILVSGKRPTARKISVRSLRTSSLKRIRPSHAQMRQRSRPAVPDDAAVVDDLLKLGGGLFALSGSQVSLSARVHVVEAGNTVEEWN
jgi:hypothetical protein